jgi:cellulose biosynthesis protein BcsQ
MHSPRPREHRNTARSLPTHPLADDAVLSAEPKVPTVVLTAWKGGVWKTSVAVSLAERLALAGLRVGLLATDAQQDARARLGVRPADPDPARVQRGEGFVVCAGLAGRQAADVLYRRPDRLGTIDLAVVDTAPSRRGMRLPGTLVIVPVFDADSTRNNVAALLAAPDTCRIVLIKTGAKLSIDDWRREVDVIEEALDREVEFAPDPLPSARAIAEAHAAGRSVWSIPRRGAARAYLEGIEVLANAAWQHAGASRPLPPTPPSGAVEAFIPGWDDASDEE